MKRTVLAVVAVVMLATALGSFAPAAADSSPEIRRVVIVSIPGLTWQDVVRQRPPALLDLVSRSAVASTSVRTIGKTTTLAEGYLTMGAGNRAIARNAGVVLPVATPLDGSTAGAVAARRTGEPVGAAVAVAPEIALIRKMNDRRRYGTEPGLLATTLAEHDRTMAVVGNGNAEVEPSPIESQLEVGLAGMDELGRVGAGDLGPRLLVDDEGAPDGVRLDADAVERSFSAAVAGNDVVLVELSDVLRATRVVPVSLPDAVAKARARAVADTDRLLSRLRSHIDLDRDLLLLTAPTSPTRGGSDQLTVGLLAGPGIEPGLLRSGTTRRAGYVTLPDIAATVLDNLGIDVPTEMSGAPMASSGGGAPDIGTVRELSRDNERALFRNRATGPLTVTLILVQVLGYVAAALVLAYGWQRWRRPLILLTLLTTAVPVVAYLSGLTPYRHLGVGGYAAAVFAAAALVAALAIAAGKVAERRGVARGYLVPPLLIAGMTAATLVVDVFLGAPLHIATPFGYGGGALVAGRFAGYGNLSTGLLAEALVIGATAWWGIRAGSTWIRPPVTTIADRRILLLTAGLFAFGIVVIGAPQLGQDVGGVLSVLPGFVLILLLAAGLKLTVRRVVLTGLGTLLVLGAFGVLDLLREPENRTHLGRLFAMVADQGVSGLLRVIERKLASNLNILTSSVWALLIPASLAFLVFLIRARPRVLRQLEDTIPGLRLCLIGTLALGVLGAVLNDSGVAIPGIMLVLALPYVSYLALHRLDQVTLPSRRAPGRGAVPTEGTP